MVVVPFSSKTFVLYYTSCVKMDEFTFFRCLLTERWRPVPDIAGSRARDRDRTLSHYPAFTFFNTPTYLATIVTPYVCCTSQWEYYAFWRRRDAASLEKMTITQEERTQQQIDVHSSARNVVPVMPPDERNRVRQVALVSA